jgi:hypothetical protein
VTLEVGRVYIIHASYIRPLKPKICLCVCELKPWFFFINSAPNRHGDSIKIAVNESDALDYDSHLDLSCVVTFQPEAIAAGVVRGQLDLAAITRTVQALTLEPRQLPKVQVDYVLSRLNTFLEIPF